MIHDLPIQVFGRLPFLTIGEARAFAYGYGQGGGRAKATGRDSNRPAVLIELTPVIDNNGGGAIVNFADCASLRGGDGHMRIGVTHMLQFHEAKDPQTGMAHIVADSNGRKIRPPFMLFPEQVAAESVSAIFSARTATAKDNTEVQCGIIASASAAETTVRGVWLGLEDGIPRVHIEPIEVVPAGQVPQNTWLVAMVAAARDKHACPTSCADHAHYALPVRERQ